MAFQDIVENENWIQWIKCKFNFVLQKVWAIIGYLMQWHGNGGMSLRKDIFSEKGCVADILCRIIDSAEGS